MPRSPASDDGFSLTADEGFSLVELVIAMFLSAILALAVLPLLVTTTRVSDENRSAVAAATFANAQLAPARAEFGNNDLTTTCTAVAGLAFVGKEDPAATGLRADVTVSACPEALPGTVTVTATVYAADDPGTALATIPTRIVVSAP
ncbi:prepilin-type N-terminal cleavage/methylation domain-containing protein [Microbacterium sp. LRZ72]|uniref:prepilin-type N-terminal cleavage/methylation domain-containing protein n=1 Tax=Microbacterium sp. LRZ72 TaxID=2942481 RepID=UPI0029BD4F1F|nr:prepilin-type N-terminal cleavage/methylation domain-containing protein [Microbacterium sp. LRZ72]MDX2377132.1 prepilin-type N-terminal cleavage/methylation domain-containing protein [Microbacterium sp. LRZ72]